MTEEEKQVILNLKDFMYRVDNKYKLNKTNSKILKDILNLIDKQQKEIEALKEHNGELAKFILNLNPKLINIDKNELVIDKNNFAKFKIE